ncbi:multidrug ABC transporter permease [Fictibacillus macauensis ZFHKF-1]|uniref:Multidrug ABC transporter permease n=1 Tax=Fictibacillus macauensis ZFHKF-1 TaxID=1196324 RepID=I8UFV1_9BACL|nr:ABC transporter permease [Fictibacillus macauensis]EIT85775.1 multidrug ABC transporter permease [Fictibacillus macauensis ZFHKF-1]
MTKLVHNELLKLFRKKKLFVALLIVAILVPMFTYAQYEQSKATISKTGNTDWRARLQQEIVDTTNRLGSSGIQGDYKKFLKIRLSQQQYYLDHNIDPKAPGAPTFMRIFLENAIDLLLPLLIMIVASDLVSSELSGGTIKLLLTRPVKRWKILLSKYIALLLSVSFIVTGTAILTYVLSGIVFGYSGWQLPMLTGFSTQGEELITQNVHLIPQWHYLFMELGLVWFVCLIVGTLTFMLSVLLRSTAAVMGIMLASLISGAILANMVSSWESAKYLFMVNLKLTSYISGMSPPIEGMSLGFSMSVLTIWAFVALVLSFIVFTKRDVY